MRKLIVSTALALGLIAPAGLVRAEQRDPGEEKDLKSESGDTAATLTFVNKSGKPVKVYWLDYRGERKHYRTLGDGESYDQPTYLTHPWVVTDEDDTALLVYLPEAAPRTVEIKGP